MTSLYFNAEMSIEELRKNFREQCLKLHPDKGGNQYDFSAMNMDFWKYFPGSRKNKSPWLQVLFQEKNLVLGCDNATGESSRTLFNGKNKGKVRQYDNGI